MADTFLLDLDGTLVDSVPDLNAALGRLLARHGLAGFSEAETTKMVGDGAATLVARAFAARGGAAGADAVEAFVADYTAHALDATRPYPGVVATLAALVRDGWRLAVCTNKPAAATHEVLDGLGLAGFFAAVGGGDSFAFRKPDPRHPLATLAAAGGDPRRAVMAGDHRNDIAASRGAGIPAIFAAWGYGGSDMAEGAAAIASHFSELPALARGLLG